MKKYSLLFYLLICLQACSYLPEKLEPNEAVTLTENRDYIAIEPTDGTYASTGLMFYIGGLVDPHAYVNWASEFAVEGDGHKVVIVKMPANLAVLAANKGKGLTEEFEEIERWVVGGHSLGGAMACTLVDDNRSLFEGLVLMAAYPASSVDLSDWSGTVLSISASNDGYTTEDEIENSKAQLPTEMVVNSINDIIETTENRSLFYEIEGGIHSYFGDYGLQEGDGTPTITQEEQQTIIVDWLQAFFEANGWN